MVRSSKLLGLLHRQSSRSAVDVPARKQHSQHARRGQFVAEFQVGDEQVDWILVA
jgi:hypothetical protein